MGPFGEILSTSWAARPSVSGSAYVPLCASSLALFGCRFAAGQGHLRLAVSNDAYVAGLVALAARADLEFDGLAFLKRRFVVSALDIGVVDEDVIAVLSGDEAEALGGVEEFHGSCCQCSSFLASPEPKASSPTKT